MAVLKNRAKMSTSTTGTGTITLGSAEDGYQSFADAGVANADVVRYVIEDGNNWEIGTGTYTATGTTLSRTVSESSNSDAAINLSGSATVFIGATAEDIPSLYAAETTGSTDPTASGTLSIAIGSGTTVSGNQAVGIGKSSTVAGFRAAAFGGGNIASQEKSFALGFGSTSQGTRSAALYGTVTAADSLSFGTNSYVQGSFAAAFGYNADITSAGTNGLALGYNSYVAGSGATALTNSYASGANSFAAVIANNTSSYGSSGANSIAMGQQAKAGGADNVAIGYSTLSNGTGSISLGYNAGTNSNYAAALGNDALANATRSLALGYSSQALSYGSTAIGYDARCAINYGLAFGLNGSAFMADTGFELMQLCCDTTDATATVMTTDNSGASDSNTIKVDAFSIVAFDAMIVARQKDDGGTDCAIFKVTGAAREESGNSTVTLLNSATTVVHNPENMAIAVSANTSNGTVDFTFTGLASHDIRAVATVQVTRLKYD